MAKSITSQIRDKALAMLEQNPDGLRYSELRNGIYQEGQAGFNSNTINGAIWNLDATLSGKVYKPSKGLFRLLKYKEKGSDELSPIVEQVPTRIPEEEFYEPFADWLQNELEDVTKAIPLGKAFFGEKWGTPDVIGKRESKRSDIIQAPIEIVSAEIKTETYQLITAFGQACAYRLFSHKSYLVIPKASPKDQIARLDSLCQIYGIGLVLFNTADPENPDFELRTRAIHGDPDIFYTNKYMAKIEKELFD